MRIAAKPTFAYGLMIGITAVALGALVSLSGVAGETVAIDRLWLGLGALAICAWIALARLVLPASPPPHISRRLAVAPVVILGVAFSFFANGIGSLLTHQAAWGLIGLGGAILAVSRLGRGMFPPWLIAFALLVPALELGSGASMTAVYDTGIGTIVLFTAWHVTSGFGDEGGVRKFLYYVAAVYWGITVAGIIVGLTHISLGSMTPETVELPWVGGPNGNKVGYGIVSDQVGRMLSMIVCAYHLVSYRSHAKHRGLHAALAATAAIIFLFQYGRIPLVGGVIVLTLIFATGRQGTNVKALILIFVIVIFGFFSGSSDSGSVSLRLGAKGWDSGHAALWSQQITLFAFDPLGGVSGQPTESQLFRAQQEPVLPALQTYDSLSVYGSRLTTALQEKGARGEGGWTGLLAQRGAIGAGIIIALMLAAAMTVVRPFKNLSPDAFADATLLRAILPATLIWYVTDLQPAGFTTFPDYVVLQLTMFATVWTVRNRYALRSSVTRRFPSSWIKGTPLGVRDT